MYTAAADIHPGMYTSTDLKGFTDGDIELSTTPPPQMPATLESGKNVAYCVGEPWNQQAVAKGIGVPVTTNYVAFHIALRANPSDAEFMQEEANSIKVPGLYLMGELDRKPEDIRKHFHHSREAKSPRAWIWLPGQSHWPRGMHFKKNAPSFENEFFKTDIDKQRFLTNPRQIQRGIAFDMIYKAFKFDVTRVVNFYMTGT